MVESVKQLSRIGFDMEKGTYWGEVLHLCAAETFKAESVDELRQLLRESVLDRHEVSGLTAAPPADLFYECVVLELEPALHQKLNQQAMLYGKSLNKYILDTLAEIAEQSQIPEPI